MKSFVHQILWALDLEQWAIKAQQWLRKAQFSKGAQIKFMSDLNSLLPYVGQPMAILRHIAEFSTGPRADVAKHMMATLSSGKFLADGMRGWFDPVLVEAVRVGEEQGVLHETLNEVLPQLSSRQSGFKKAFLVVLYPAGLITIALSAIRGIEQKFLPTMMRMAGNDVQKLPSEMQTLVLVSDVVFSWGWLILAAIVGVVVGVRWILKNYTGPYREALDKLPIFSSYRLLLGAKYMQLYAILKRVNEAEKSIIKLCKQGAEPYYLFHLKRMERKLNSGEENIADVVDTGLIAKEEIERLRLLSGATDYIVALESAASHVYEKTLANVNSISRMAVVVGLAITGWLVTTIILAMLSVDQLNSSFP